MTPEEAKAELARREASRPVPTANSGGEQPTQKYGVADFMDALKVAGQNPEIVKAQNDKLKRQESFQMPRNFDELVEYTAAMGRGHFLGNDTFDSVGAGIATAMALPGAVSKRRKEKAVPEEGLKSYLNDALALAPDIYGEMKGSIDEREAKFNAENPVAADKLGYVGDVAQGYGLLKGGLPMAKSAFNTAWKPTGGALWKAGNEILDNTVGGLAKAAGRAFRGL